MFDQVTLHFVQTTQLLGEQLAFGAGFQAALRASSPPMCIRREGKSSITSVSTPSMNSKVAGLPTQNSPLV